MSEWQEYAIRFTRTAKRNLKDLAKQLGKKLSHQLEAAISNLVCNPIGKTQPLGGELHEYRSLHVSRCRVIVKVDDVTVTVYVVAAGWHTSRDRNDIYQEFGRILGRGGDAIESDLAPPPEGPDQSNGSV